MYNSNFYYHVLVPHPDTLYLTLLLQNKVVGFMFYMFIALWGIIVSFVMNYVNATGHVL